VATPQIHKITEHHTALQKKAHTIGTQSLTKSHHISNADSNSSLAQQKSIPQAERTTRELVVTSWPLQAAKLTLLYQSPLD
jgi:hypothetical protein